METGTGHFFFVTLSPSVLLSEPRRTHTFTFEVYSNLRELSGDLGSFVSIHHMIILYPYFILHRNLIEGDLRS